MMNVFVTGGASGIGRAIVDRLLSAGHSVWVHYRSSQSRAEELASKVEELYQADLSGPEGRERLVDKVPWETLDGLVNNAGVAAGGPAVDRTEEDWSHTLDVNLLAPATLCRHALDRLGEGSVVNVTSIRGLAEGTRPGLTDYSASKAALENLTRSLAQAGAPDIRVNAVAPGFTNTPMTSGLSEEQRQAVADATLLDRFGEPDEIAKAVVFLLSDQASYVTGASLTVDGGYTVQDPMES